MAIEKRYIVARNDWCAKRILKKVYNGRLSMSVLFNTFQDAVRRKQRMRQIDQESFSIFEVPHFDPEKVKIQ